LFVDIRNFLKTRHCFLLWFLLFDLVAFRCWVTRQGSVASCRTETNTSPTFFWLILSYLFYC